MQGTQVRILVQELRFRMPRGNWAQCATTTEPTSRQLPKPQHPFCTREATTVRGRRTAAIQSSPHSHNWRTLACSNQEAVRLSKDPAQPKLSFKKINTWGWHKWLSIWKKQNQNLTPALLLILKYFPHGVGTQKRTVRQNTRELGKGGRILLNMRGNPKTFQEIP